MNCSSLRYVAAACCHCVEHEGSAYRTLHRSHLAKRTANEAVYRYPSMEMVRAISEICILGREEGLRTPW
jgi:hypothetical protein